MNKLEEIAEMNKQFDRGLCPRDGKVRRICPDGKIINDECFDCVAQAIDKLYANYREIAENQELPKCPNFYKELIHTGYELAQQDMKGWFKGKELKPMRWRPEGWTPPFLMKRGYEGCTCDDCLFESGADAIVVALVALLRERSWERRERGDYKYRADYRKALKDMADELEHDN